MSQRLARRVVDNLGVDVVRASKDGETWPDLGPIDLLADTKLAALAPYDSHSHGVIPYFLAPLPALPAFSRTFSP